MVNCLGNCCSNKIIKPHDCKETLFPAVLYYHMSSIFISYETKYLYRVKKLYGDGVDKKIINQLSNVLEIKSCLKHIFQEMEMFSIN